ncbi:MAG: murein hydrolase activator EnvC family protein [Bacteroidota bacterium]
MAPLAAVVALFLALAGAPGAARAQAPARVAAAPAPAKAAPGKPAAPPPATAAADSAADNSGAEIEAQKKELESLRQQIDQRRQLSKQLRGRERNILGDLRDTEKNLQLTARYLTALERRQRAVAGDLGETTSELGRTVVQLESDRRRLAWRLREIYKRGRSRDIEYILSARSFGDLVTRTYYLARVAREDHEQMLVTQARRVEVQDTKTRLESRKRELDRIAAETTREKIALAQLKDQRRSLLRQVRSDTRSNEQAQAELQRASKRIQGLIEELEKRRLAAEKGAPGLPPVLFGNFALNKGRLPWPVTGKVAVGFGNITNPRFGTTTFNSGVDISAPFGAPIAAVAKGRVDYVNWLEGFGKCAILNHGGGFYTLYAHASEISVPVGKDVAAGEVIGRVGDTGSTIGTALHFEIRRGKQALNPLEWLR